MRTALAALALLVAFASLARADDKSAALVREARRRVRRHDVAGALQSLAQATDAADVDARVLEEDLLRRGRDEATLLTQYRQKAQAGPDDALAACLFARLLPPDEAVRELDKIAARFPDLAFVHEARAAALAGSPGAVDRAKDVADELDKAVAAAPREARYRVALARNLERQALWPQAIEAWKMADGLRPNDLDLLVGWGDALRRSGALDEAVAQFEAAAKLDPTDAEPPYRIGLARLDGARRRDALKSFDAAIALDRRHVEACCAAVRASLGLARETAAAENRDVVEADFAQAVDYGTKAVQADAASAAAHLALAAAHEAAAEIAPARAEAALGEYDTAAGVAATASDRLAAACGRAYALLLAGRTDECLAAADKAIQIDAQAVTAYLCGARALAAAGRHADAVKTYLAAGLKATPGEPLLLHARGIALRGLGKTSDAKKDLEAAALAEPKNGRFQLSVGELYYQLKMYKPAAAALVAATEDRPRDASAWRVLGRAQTSLKDWENAATAFERVVTLVESRPASAPPVAAPSDPAKPDAAAPAQPAAASPPLATPEHLELAVIYADHLSQADKAKAHARQFVEQGGTDPSMDDWIKSLLEGK